MAEAAKAAADVARAAAEWQAHYAQAAAAESEQEKADLRAKLRQQLELILETRETARGLIVNLSDVLFDTGRATLKPGAREKLAKVAGVLLAHPGLEIEVDGHTDGVGTDAYNQPLSEQRAASVRDYLVRQGIASGAITAHGFGESTPVVSNNTAASAIAESSSSSRVRQLALPRRRTAARHRNSGTSAAVTLVSEQSIDRGQPESL